MASTYLRKQGTNEVFVYQHWLLDRKEKDMVEITDEEAMELLRTQMVQPKNFGRILPVVAVVEAEHEPMIEPEAEGLEATSAGLEVAKELLAGDGLSHSSWMRKMGFDCDNSKLRRDTKAEYHTIVASFEGKIKMQGLSWHWGE